MCVNFTVGFTLVPFCGFQDQYEFVYDALVEEIEMGDTSKSCAEFIHDHPDSCQSTSQSMSMFDLQLQVCLCRSAGAKVHL